MSSGQIPIISPLVELCRRFDLVATNYPSVDAVVVYRPDVRSSEAESQARKLFVKPANPDSEHYAIELAEQNGGTHSARACAMQWDRWIPPSNGSIEQLGGQTYWARILSTEEFPISDVSPYQHDMWHCTLFGPRLGDLSNPGNRLFTMYATDAVRLLLPTVQLKGKALLSYWLIHLADRDEPILPGLEKSFLAWSNVGELQPQPRWVPKTDMNPPSPWWAVRLPNVFYLSRLAIEEAINRLPQNETTAQADIGESTPGDMSQLENKSKETNELQWSPALKRSEWVRVLGVSANTVSTRLTEKKSRDRARHNGKTREWQVRRDDLEGPQWDAAQKAAAELREKARQREETQKKRNATLKRQKKK